MPSPSASVVESLESVPAGAEPRNTPPPTLAPICAAGPEICNWSEVSSALMLGSTLRTVFR